MSNLIPYFVLAVVALGFFAVCYAVFSGGDGESKAKEKSYKNISNKNNLKEHHDVIFATESQEGNVTITHTSGTNVYILHQFRIQLKRWSVKSENRLNLWLIL